VKKNQKFVILDRDGVINYDSENYVKSGQEWIPIPGSLEAIRKLNNAGWKVVIATNQSGIARKLYSVETLAQIHNKLQKQLFIKNALIDGICFCPHHPDENCQCRKPKTGLIDKILCNFNIEKENTFFIGDSEKDMIAAHDANVRKILVRTGNGKRTEKKLSPAPSMPVYDDLLSAVDALLAQPV
jgi:D-glycero-D-manno-heptose 1,7-bisphosphate phosphatase